MSDYHGYPFPTPADRLREQLDRIKERRAAENARKIDDEHAARLRKEIRDLGEEPCA